MAFWAGMGGAALGAITNMFGQSSANEQNKREAKKNRDWQQAQATTAFQRNRQAAQEAFDRSMYAASTTHQREVADLRAAGLNPILSAGGSGAPAPTSAAATAQSGSGGQARVDSVTREAAEAATKSTALALGTQRKQNEILDEQLRRAEAEADLAEGTLAYKIAQELNNVSITANTAENLEARNQTLGAELIGKLVEADIDASEYGELMRHLDRAIPIINAAGNAIPFRDVLDAFSRRKGNRSEIPGRHGRSR